MTTISRASFETDIAPLDIDVQGPDGAPVPDGDLRRLFPGTSLTERRLERLRDWPRIVVRCGTRIVALATCKKTDVELRVPDLAFDPDCGCGHHEVLGALLDAVELAGLAGGCQRIIVMPPHVSPAFLERRGYTAIRERCAGGWLEKPLG
ncbi:MAG TPA: hypothetical protein VD833_20405 [Vicinamibacterales bacterium]|nr:hypothetical protein [Vicinamibacterales bacterium]